MYQIQTHADMKSTLALESVCAEYQPVPGKNFICWDWMALYGGDTFSMDHVTAVLRERLDRNLDVDGAEEASCRSPLQEQSRWHTV